MRVMTFLRSLSPRPVRSVAGSSKAKLTTTRPTQVIQPGASTCSPNAVAAPSTSALVLGAATALGEHVLAPGWITCVGLVVVSFALLLPATLLTGLGESDRRNVITRMRQIWQGVRGG